MIYLDNAATSYQKPEAVYQAVQEAMHHMGNSGRGAHGASLDASRQIYSARELLAELFHAGDPARVAFTANSTESLNMAVFGLFGPGDHVITTMLEHNSVLRPLYLLEEAGLELTILPADQNGCICYEDIEKAIKPNTKGIICTHASNLT
ncbi:aminotransferase class V-fold PLP-dependent enzyme, partial [Hungatella effluvii]